MSRFIYLDNAATTQVSQDVLRAMLPYYARSYGNPSSIYEFGEKNKKAVSESREIIAKSLKAKTGEIYFTSGGSESDNWALNYSLLPSQLLQLKGQSCHVITTQIEHHAILNKCKSLEKQRISVTYVKPDENGIINPQNIKRAVRPNTRLISVMFANNEIGTIQPIREIGEIAKNNNIVFHTDAVQAYGHIPIDVNECNIDMLSASAHKLNGPKGIGFLYIREGVNISPLIFGGAQENGKRAGTENVPSIVGFGEAVKLSMERMEYRIKKETNLKNYLIKRILEEIPYSRINGSLKNRLPNNVNVSFQFIEGDNLLVLLDMAGICASVGSACASGSKEPSHVLRAIGLPDEIAYGTLRLTLCENNTRDEIDYVMSVLKSQVMELRKKNAHYEEISGKY